MLFNELLNDAKSRVQEVKALQKFAIVNQLGEMINPTEYGYEVGFYAEWTYDISELDNAVDLCCWMSEKWNNELYVIPCANVDERVF